MANKLLDDVAEKMKDEESIRGALNVFVWFIIVAVVALCEIMYIKIMVIGFPDGLIQAIAIVGAVATGFSVIALYAGKNYWFSKGHQTWAAWGFTGVEISVLVLNVLLAFNFNSTSGVLQTWKQAYPAAPIIALVGWGFILYLDRENIMRRKQRTMQEQQHDSEIKYEQLVHKTRMAVKTASLEIVANKLEQKVQATDNLQALDAIADQIYQALLGEISGKHYTQLPNSRTIQQLPPAQEVTGQFVSTPKDSTNVPQMPVLPAMPDPEKLGRLLDMAVTYGQMSEEEARPLRQALGTSATPQSKNGAH